jgi:hypothetical protein
MKNWINTHYKSLIIGAFLIPIITVAIVSISHVTMWYGISNPISWAVYLSIGIEIAALSALAAISADMGKKVYFPFSIVTLVQFIGNIFFAYSYIDINSTLFKDWVDLVSPFVSFMGVEEGDLVGHKRFLALFAGGMLPIISLSFLHMLIKFTEEDRKKEIEEEKKEIEPIQANHLMSEVSKVRLSEEDLKKLEEVLLNPPSPNENLKKAAEEYKKKVELTDEEILKRSEQIQLNKVFEEAEIIKQEREKEFGSDNIEEEPFEEKKSIFPEEVEYPEEYNRPVYPTKEEMKDILSEMMRLDQELGLYNTEKVMEPSVAPKNAQEMMLTSDDDIISSIPSDDEISDMDLIPSDNVEVNQVTPALGDDEIREMFMDEWERKFDLVEEEDFSTIEPTKEEEEKNFSNIEPISENIFQEEQVEEPVNIDVAVDNEPEIGFETEQTSTQNEEDEKKN